ncbi:DUF3006 domain-containing protein [Virgibacillus halodenitrificans]|uniref:DUF3006 domain-containing protein n=1 Tax=Virgibacillus halodenitrificans TaxID=1482 RepID=UPI000EF50369|nr:DUF3006 domain-containing protein [Virgibacillus halodenitrificans]
MRKYTVDRFEGSIAVLLLRDDETTQLDVPKKDLPENVQQGDILEVDMNEGSVKTARILQGETANARDKAEALLKKILDKNN